MAKHKDIGAGHKMDRNEYFLKEVLRPQQDGGMDGELKIRNRIGRNMKLFLRAYMIGVGKKANPDLLVRQWNVLKGAGSAAIETLNSIQRRRAFLQLERQGYVYRIENRVDGKLIILFKFTAKGQELQKFYSDGEKLDRLILASSGNTKSDREMHVVSWDIPEAFRRKRALFRNFVKRIGFHMLHKSFFIGAKNVVEFILKAARLLDIDAYIHCGTYKSTIFAGIMSRA